MNKTTIIIMAAGLGSRYGGDKQVDGLGPNNEVIMDYSVYDALAAGFNKVVFIIKKSMYASFEEKIGRRISQKCEVVYAFQEYDSIPTFYEIPKERIKPFGTAHALLCAKEFINEPFCVFNADDYYGKDGFIQMHSFLSAIDNSHNAIKKYAMVGYDLQNTISQNGSVTRGVCRVDQNNMLLEVVETYKIKAFDDGTIRDINFNENGDIIANDNPVSMNFWGFTPDFFDFLEAYFYTFLKNLASNELKKECLLPAAVDTYMKTQACQVVVLTSHSKWFGVTYQEDRASVMDNLKKLHDSKMYPPSLIK